MRCEANYSNIEVVLIGSCNVGNKIDDFISTTKNSHIVWIFSYTYGIIWMAFSLIDVSVFMHLMRLMMMHFPAGKSALLRS